MKETNISLDGASFQKKRFNTLFLAATVTSIVSFLSLLADSIIVGHYVGATGVAAINIVSPIVAICGFISELNGIGTGYVCSRYAGEFKRTESEKALGQGLIVAAAVTGLLVFCFAFLWEPYLDYMRLSEAVRAETAQYWRFERFMLLLYPVNYLLAEVVYMDGDENTSNVANAVMMAGSIILSVLFCSLMGIAGAGLGSFLGILSGTVILSTHFLRKSGSIRPIRHFSGKLLKEATALAITDALPSLCWGALSFCLNKIVISRFSDSYLPLVTMVINILEITLVFDGIGTAMAPLAEIYMGERNYSGEKELARYGFKVAVAEGIIAHEIMFILAPIIPSLYGITSGNIASEAVTAVRLMSLSLLFASILFFFTSQYRLVREIKVSILATVCGQFLFVVLFALLLVRPLGLEGIWLSFLAAYGTVMISFGIVLVISKGWNRFPWLCPKEEDPSLNCTFFMSRQNIMTACERFTEFLRGHGISETVINQVNLIIEETGTLSFEENKQAENVAEYTVSIRKDGIYIITRDTCRLKDITQTKGSLDDVQKYVVERILASTEDTKYLETAGFNRCYYRIPRKGGNY